MPYFIKTNASPSCTWTMVTLHAFFFILLVSLVTGLPPHLPTCLPMWVHLCLYFFTGQGLHIVLTEENLPTLLVLGNITPSLPPSFLPIFLYVYLCIAGMPCIYVLQACHDLHVEVKGPWVSPLAYLAWQRASWILNAAYARPAWPANFRDSSVSTSHLSIGPLGLKCTLTHRLLHQPWGFALRSSNMLGKYFTEPSP